MVFSTDLAIFRQDVNAISCPWVLETTKLWQNISSMQTEVLWSSSLALSGALYVREAVLYQNGCFTDGLRPLVKSLFSPRPPGSHKNSPIFTTATPPRSHNQNLFCVGSDGYIRAQWIPTPLVKAAIVMIEHSPSRRWRKSMPEASAKALSTARFLLLLCCLGHILLSLSGKSICAEVPVQWK